MTCRELTEVITDYLEGRMSFMDRVRFRVHIGMCRGCRAYLDQMKQTIRTIGRLPPEDMPPDVQAQLLERFREWKQ
ncbi:MAG: anti-sigma factor [Acidobacteria bacterium RIFCSPLOWO2_12_FULL_67_14]|nr:MAG: anti-sigma factor [Acidobacteria bacterium RIFCSPLOWO2_02_FULL_67_21]OFW37861.1 MAG: anti-sigma factor [Acidobacteria bacterium RIFCSPLOWO2_12_FULL_67_14]